MSIRARIALFGGTVVALAVLLFGLVVYFPVKARLEDQLNSELSQQATGIARQLHRPGFLGQPAIRVPFGAQDLRKSSESFVELLDPSGTPVDSTGKLDGVDPVIPAAVLQATSPTNVVPGTVKENDVTLRVYVG
ncbi:MAG TPA: hypothetical protein VET82_12515, partial [Candidatus Eisenbacteria bacterium]|nr:hypothetical protein [Candidatus Eisenbacteria bacterium]